MTYNRITGVETLTPVKARQGVISGRIRLVLAVSLALVVVAFVIIYIVGV